MKWILRCVVIVFFLGCIKPIYADERTDRIRPMIEEYVQQITVNNLLKTVSDVFEHAIKAQNLQILPQVSYEAVQQTVLQIFKQQNLLEFVQDAYQQSVDAGMDALENDGSPEEIQDKIKKTSDEAIAPIMQDRYFQHVVTEMLKNAMRQTRAMTAQVAAQQYVKQAAIQRAVMQQAIVAQYQQMVQNLVKQNVQMQHEYQQQIQNTQNQLQQQYLKEQQLLRQQQILQQQGHY